MRRTEAPPPRRPRLGERRTKIKEMPEEKPREDSTAYLMQHQICVPGGWETVATKVLRGSKGLAGVYGPIGQMLAHPEVRKLAADLCKTAEAKLTRHPYRRLDELVTTVTLQEGHDEPGGWNDPAVAVEIAAILRKHHIL